MRIQTERVVLALLLGLGAAAYTAWVHAAPMPPRQVVNHQTHQCAEIVPGDECGDVVLPAGWEYLEGQCPDQYTLADLRPEWIHFKATFCCSEGHSGSPGDCQDVVQQPILRQCAFVNDLPTCAGLPAGWLALGRECPAGFTWVDEVICTGNGVKPTLAQTAESGSEHTAPTRPASPPPPERHPSETPAPTLPTGVCTGAAFLWLIVIALKMMSNRVSSGG